MSPFLKSLYHGVLHIPGLLTPDFVSIRIDTERYSIDKFVKEVVVPEIRPIDRILDAGAGRMQFKPLLDFAHYESTDFEDVFHKDSQSKHTFICSLDDIPKPDNTYDVVLNTQVLEHVEYPQKVINEFFRILKPGGKLFLTTNQMFPLHHVPYNFYFFTSFGLSSLYKNAGFEILYLEPRGGIFWLLAKIFNTISPHIFYQVAYDGHKKYGGFKPKIKKTPMLVIYVPLYILSQFFFGTIIAFICFLIDGLDKQKYFTLGYSCICIKPQN